MVWRKRQYQAIRNMLTSFIIWCMITSMINTSVFLKPGNINFREYITNHRRIACNLSGGIKAVVVLLTTAALFFFYIGATKTHINLNSKSWGFSF